MFILNLHISQDHKTGPDVYNSGSRNLSERGPITRETCNINRSNNLTLVDLALYLTYTVTHNMWLLLIKHYSKLHLSWISTIFGLDVIANNYNENLALITNKIFYSWYLGGFLTILPDLILSSTFGGVDTGELCFVFGF